ncbi:glycosyltransferase family A protein [Mycoplasmoides pirum]|uniref:glycosyltransferase family A protein n=1 Tax=Mycoplasmoides pirum TaxID=2122 RepID=UPI000484F337|nr:glycosyltransferase family A protein [Mycoplasmoides pirum]
MHNYNFSIIIPYYNTNIEQTKFCLESLICQDLSLLKEIIVVNDGSDDKYSEQIYNLIKKINSNTNKKEIIKLINQENKGPVLARKTGFYNSTGDVILFVDPDDWIYDSNAIYKLNDYFKNNKTIELICIDGSCVYTSEIKNIKIKKKTIKTYIKNFDMNWYFNDNLKPYSPVTVWRYAYKKKILDDINFWQSLRLPYDDFYFNSYLISKEKIGLVTNEPFYIYRKYSPGSISNKSSKLNPIQKIDSYTKWFTSFDYNIYTSKQCYEYWTSIYIELGASTIGYRKLLMSCDNNNIPHPSIKEMKKFIKKYKIYGILRKFIVWMCLYIPWIDFIFPKIYKLFKN